MYSLAVKHGPDVIHNKLMIKIGLHSFMRQSHSTVECFFQTNCNERGLFLLLILSYRALEIQSAVVEASLY